MESPSASVIEHRVKTILLGDSGVGKTSYMECFKNGPKASRITHMTTGPEYISHKFTVDDVVMKVNIWDTAGQEIYRALNKTFYREAKGGLIVVDLSDVPKKESLEYWYKEFKAHSDPKSQVIIIGNKADLDQDKETLAMLKQFASQMNLRFFEVSALNGLNVEDSMQQLISLITEIYYKDNQAQSPLFQSRKRGDFGESVRLSENTVMTEKSSGSKSTCCGKN